MCFLIFQFSTFHLSNEGDERVKEFAYVYCKICQTQVNEWRDTETKGLPPIFFKHRRTSL